MFRDVPECSGMFHVPDFIDGRQICHLKLFSDSFKWQIWRPSIKPGTWNIPENRIILIIMRKICNIKFSKIKQKKNKLVSARNMNRYFGGYGIGRGGVASAEYSFNCWPQWVQAPLFSRQLRHVVLQHFVFQHNDGRLGRWMPGNSLRFLCWSLISSTSEVFVCASYSCLLSQ